MPALLMILPILDISDFIVASNSAGVLPTGSVPTFNNFSLMSGSFIARTTSMLAGR